VASDLGDIFKNHGVEVMTAPPNLSLNPDASPAALTRRPLGAG
jgi:hypothetical protein